MDKPNDEQKPLTELASFITTALEACKITDLRVEIDPVNWEVMANNEAGYAAFSIALEDKNEEIGILGEKRPVTYYCVYTFDYVPSTRHEPADIVDESKGEFRSPVDAVVRACAAILEDAIRCRLEVGA